MKRVLLLFILIAPSFSLVAQEHFGVFFTQDGIEKVLQEAVSGISERNQNHFLIPNQVFDGVVPKRDINDHPIISRLNKFAIFSFDDDVHYQTVLSPITIDVEVDKKSIKTSFEGVSRTNTNFNIQFRIKKLGIQGKKIEICEVRKNDKNCKPNLGLYGKFEDYKLNLRKGDSIDVLVKFRVVIINGKASLRLKNIYTNLLKPNTLKEREAFINYNLSTKHPKLDISFKKFTIPEPEIVIDGHIIRLDTSKLTEMILAEKEFLSQKLVEFSGEFISNNLSHLINESVLKEISNLNTEVSVDYDRDNYVTPRKETASHSFIEEMQEFLGEVFYQAYFDLSVESMKTVLNDGLLVNTKTNLKINNEPIKTYNYVKNSVYKKLKPIDAGDILLEDKEFDFALAVSEPLVNSILGFASRKGMFNKALHKFTEDLDGIKLTRVSLYFESPKHIVAVADIDVTLSKLRSEGILSWIGLRIGSFLEKDHIYFPLELKITPELISDRDGQRLEFKIDNPFAYKGLKNTYQHPYKSMHSAVESKLIDALKENLIPLLETEIPQIDLDGYLSYKGVELEPKGIVVRDTGHLVIKGNINKIDLMQLMEK